MSAAAHSARLDAVAAELDLPPAPSMLDRTDAVLLAAAAHLGGMPVAQLMNGQDRRSQHARHLFCLAARRLLERSWGRIGQLIDRDPSTVISSVVSAERRLTTDSDFAAAYEWLRDRFGPIAEAQR